METAKEKVERMKGKAEIFLKNNTRAFIVDTSNNYYFSYVLVVGEDYLYIEDFHGKRKGERSRIVWFDILRFDEYKEEEDLKKNEI